jgi:hypothetical protein
MNTAAPHAVITHQIACVAVVKSVPCALLTATTVPDTATPIAAPTCRLVEAIAAATPACDSGIPATALSVIAGFTIPNPTPNSAYAASSQPGEVCWVKPVSISVLTRNAIPAATREGRVPKLPTNRPDHGAHTIIAIAKGSVNNPV